LPDNGLFSIVEGGPSKAVVDGRFVLTELLTADNFTIHINQV
jgi:hypothetical protein